MKDAGIFLGCEKNKGIFGVAKKGLRDFLQYAKKVVIFIGRKILKLWFLPPSLLKFVSWAPGSSPFLYIELHIKPLWQVNNIIILRAFGSNLKPLVLPKRVIPSQAFYMA